MSYFKASQKTSELSELRRNGWVKGVDTGWACLDEIFSLKKGYPLFIAGAPGSGKTEWTLDLLVNCSLLHRWKHFIYLGENGEIEEIIADIAFKYIKKPFRGKEQYSMSESENIQAQMWIDEHFVFLDDSQDYSLEEFYKKADEAEMEFGIKFDTTLFDPFNDADENLEKHGGREDKYLKDELKIVRRISKKNNRIDILVNHIAKVPATVDKSTGARYLPPALPDDWAGGRTWWRRAFCMILVYIPPKWMCDENGIPYGENISLVYIQKAKPKGVAKLGNCKLLWNWKTNRYEEAYIPNFVNRQPISQPKEITFNDSPF